MKKKLSVILILVMLAASLQFAAQRNDQVYGTGGHPASAKGWQLLGSLPQGSSIDYQSEPVFQKSLRGSGLWQRNGLERGRQLFLLLAMCLLFLMACMFRLFCCWIFENQEEMVRMRAVRHIHYSYDL